MTTLGSCHHDFPRLAEQSGYFFQLYGGRVNWTEIENVNVEELVEKRNFQLLEQNLVNVVNCNLEREYDLKILDQKFVKLFKIAQLGVDYLSYCQMYVDRCVVLLQEQLIALQEENEKLKEENRKKNEDIKKSKNKNRIQSYQCEKCEKVFISEVYLKFHDKRRHSNPTTPKSSSRKCVDFSQQTEEERKSTSSQTALSTVETEDVKKENNEKIENLERELEELKIRLNKAETTLTEASNSNSGSKLNISPPPHQPPPIFYPQMLPFLPPGWTSQRHFIEGFQPTVQEYCPSMMPNKSSMKIYEKEPDDTVNKADKENTEIEGIKNRNETKIHFHKKDEETEEKVERTQKADEVKKLKTKNNQNKQNEIEAYSLVTSKNHEESQKMEDKENVHPEVPIQLTVLQHPVKPTPIPRKSKLMLASLLSPLTTKEETTVESFAFPNPIQTPFESQSITRSSTPVPDAVEPKENVIRERQKSLMKKVVVVGRKSPRLRELSRSLKRSMTNLYGSVGIGREENTETVGGLEEELRVLGVDPEWPGIPKRTMKQKLKALKHRRKMWTKENPMFPVIRQSIEKKIVKTLGKNYLNFRIMKKTVRANEQESIETGQTSSGFSETPTVVAKPAMYDVDTDPESEVSGQEAKAPAPTEKEHDLSIFQITRKQIAETEKEVVVMDDLNTDSDFDDFLTDFNNQGTKKYILDEEKDKPENQSILKSNQTKQQISNKKKVFFAEYSGEVGKNAADQSSDDLWSLKSDWDEEG